MGTIDAVGGKLGGLFSGVGQGVATIGKMLPYLLLGLIVGAIIYLLYEEFILYKYRVTLKRIVGKSKVIIHDRACEKRLKNGARIWHFKKLNIDKAEPPNDVLMVSQGGKIEVQGWLVNDNNIIWAKDDFDLEFTTEEIKKALAKEKKLTEALLQKKPITEDMKLTEAEKSLLVFNSNNQPVSTNDRLAIAQAMAEKDFGKKDPMKLLNLILTWAPFVITLVLVIFGFKYFAEPLSENQARISASTGELAKIVEPLAETNKLTAEALVAYKADMTLLKEDLEFLKQQRETGIIRGSAVVNQSGQ